MADQILQIPAVPDGLREASQVGLLIPFVGAGASRLAGCPGWGDFADRTLHWLIEQGLFSFSKLDQIRHLNPRVKLSLARMLERETNTAIDYKALLHPAERKSHPKGVRLYNALFELASTFVTTNYDEWLDERLPNPAPAAAPADGDTAKKPLPTIRVVHRVDDLTPEVLGQANTVIHLHGSLREPKGMILTTQDYVTHYANDRLGNDPAQENRVLTFLDYLFTNRTVLFIGYGLEELEILEYVILKARRPPGAPEKEARHYILQGYFSHEEALMRQLKSYYLKECGIELIPFLRDERDFDQLIDVLEEFARLVPASTPLIIEKALEMEGLLDG
jgi:SIR2-like domain